MLRILMIALILVCINLRVDAQVKLIKLSKEESVNAMLQSLSHDLSSIGPASWLNYFENNDKFFMISDGDLKFPDFKVANEFITDTLVKTFSAIDLKFIATKFYFINNNQAVLYSAFTEELTDMDKKAIDISGYVEAFVERVNGKWKFQNLTWSLHH
jgi:hypothetical protein